MDDYCLPKVTKEQVASFLRDLNMSLEEEGQVEYIRGRLDQLEVSNPELLSFLHYAIQNAPEGTERKTALDLCVLHDLLLRQAQANVLEQKVALPCPENIPLVEK